MLFAVMFGTRPMEAVPITHREIRLVRRLIDNACQRSRVAFFPDEWLNRDMRTQKIIPEEPHTQFRSLSNLLDIIRPQPLDEAFRIVKDEFRLSCKRRDWIQTVLQIQMRRQDHAAWNYHGQLKVLLAAMEGQPVSPIEDEYARQMIQKSVNQWRSNQEPG